MEDVGPVTSGVKLTKHSTVEASYQQSGGGKVTVHGAAFSASGPGRLAVLATDTDNPGEKKFSQADAVGLRDS